MPVVVLAACLAGACRGAIAPALVESRKRRPEVSFAKSARRCVVDPALGKMGHIGEIARWKEVVFCQAADIDQKRVSGERGVSAVRRIAVADRPHREHLPPPLTGVSQPARERMRLGAEIAGTVSAGQGGRVEEDTARPLAEIEGHSLAP